MRGAVKKSNPPPEKVTLKGAVQSKTGLGDRSRSYWSHHRTSFLGSCMRLLATPAQTLMTSLVVAIALALPMTLLMTLDNVNELGASWDANPKVSVYLNIRAKPTAVEQFISKLEAFTEVEKVEYLSPDDALADFQEFSGFEGVLNALEQNPLPPTVIISPKQGYMGVDDLRILSERIEGDAIVDAVQMDMDWVRRLQEIMVLGKKIVTALAILLSAGVLLVIGNTIRLAIENRRDEILIAKLVGGTDGFVRRPFLYSGGWYGFFGGVLACLIVAVGYMMIEPSVERLASLYQGNFRLRGLDFASAMQMLVTSTLLGWIGAWIAVGRHLSHIEPR